MRLPLHSCLLLLLLSVSASCADRRKRRRSGNSTCGQQHSRRHQRHLGAWVADVNQTQHHLSMVQPTEIEDTRTVGDDAQPSNGQLLMGEKECPTDITHVAHNADEPLMGRSLCPWYWVANYDPNRIPSTLPAVRCRCEQALGGARHPPVLCRPVSVDVRVLRWDGVRKCGRYRPDTETIAVACVGVIAANVRLDKSAFPNVERRYGAETADFEY